MVLLDTNTKQLSLLTVGSDDADDAVDEVVVAGGGGNADR